MKVGKIIKVTTQGVEESSIEIDGWKILTGLISAGIITSIITTLTFFLIKLPQSQLKSEQNLRMEKFEILNFVLRSKSDSIRKESLIFLLNSKIIEDENNQIKQLIDKNIIPDWSNMPKIKSINNDENVSSPIPEEGKEGNNIPVIGTQ